MKVYGRVQGVSFRYYTMLAAHNLAIKGWVCNLEDGAVETAAEGTQEQLERFLDFLKVGPSGAHVAHADVQWLDASGEFEDFQIRA